MLKLGTFMDIEVGREYDLYSMNARLLRSMLDRTVTVTPLKLAMFNSDTHIKQDLETEVNSVRNTINSELVSSVVDLENGVINTFEHFDTRYTAGRVDKLRSVVENGCITLSDHVENLHHLGYELLPLAVSVAGRTLDVEGSDVHLLDGFRRMYYVNEIPDRDVFVKVYDILSPSEWQNAMLLFNSWKLASKGTYSFDNNPFDFFADRGYKFALYNYFGIDTTLYHSRAFDLYNEYVGNSVYTTLKNNGLAHLDLLLSLEMYKYFVSDVFETAVKVKSEGVNNRNYIYILQNFFKIYGKFRRLEFKEGIQSNSELADIDSFIALLGEKEVAKAVTKILKMSVPGHTQNAVREHLQIHFVNYFRTLYGLSKLTPSVYSYFYSGQYTSFSSKPSLFKSLEELELIKAEMIAENESHKNEVVKY